MPLWTTTDANTGAPKFKDADGNSGTSQYGNTIFAVDANEVSVATGVAHQGWIKRTLGQGPLTDITITAEGTGYDNADTINIESTHGVNATATIETDASGNITSVAITDYGNGFVGTESAVITTSEGADAELTLSFGGRVGRVKNEVLVAAKITSDGSDDTVFPDS